MLSTRAQETTAAYKTPLLAIPYAPTPPIIDGTISDDEWRDALWINALQTTNGQVSRRQTQWRLLWDEDHLYLALVSPLRPGERLLQALRGNERDLNVVMDDSYEIWLDVESRAPDGQSVYFQYGGNFAGARWDVIQEPAVGNFRLNWTANWTTKNRLRDDNVWECEIAIPRQSLYRDQPFRDGETIRGLLARNYKRPWEQNSLEGTGSFAVRETYSRWLLDKNAPPLHLEIADIQNNSFGLRLNTPSHDAARLHWQFSSPDFERSGTLDAPPDALDLLPPSDARFRVQVWEDAPAGRKNWLDWSAQRQIHTPGDYVERLNDGGDVVNLALDFNPVRDYLRVAGDFIGYDKRAQIARTQVVVSDDKNQVLARQDFALDKLNYVQGVLRLPPLEHGEYRAQLTAFDANNRVVLTREQKFEKKDVKSLPWWNTPHGNIERVLAPWTKVEYGASPQGKTFRVWGREMTAGYAGLPAQIVAQKQQLLARPAHLVARDAQNKTIFLNSVGTQKVVSQADHRVVTKNSATLGRDVMVETQVSVEFDGMMKIALTLDPRQKTTLNDLQLVVPLRPEIAQYIYGKGEGIRSGFDMGFLSEKSGRLWDSTRVSSQPMKVGSFLPYLWIGNTQRGLCWFANSDEGWWPNNQTPAIEVQRRKVAGREEVALIFHLASEPVTFDKARTLTFALQATPVKPLLPGWRMDTWWTGSTFQDYASVQEKGGNLIFTSLPFPLDVEKSRAMAKAAQANDHSFIFGVPRRYRGVAVPYFEHIRMGEQFAPDAAYFREEWKTRVSEGYFYGRSLQDFMIHNLGEWAKDSKIDGFYIDNMHPLADDNLDAGRGYRLPDGRVQPTYAMFETRDYFLRMRAVFQETRGQSKVVLHMTNNMIMPWVEAADVALDGEDKVIYPNSERDFMDEWSLERLRLDFPQTWGVPVNFLHEYQGQWEPKRLAQAMRAYTGMMLLHDVLASSNANGLNQPVWIARDRFGIASPDVRFLPYWDENRGLKTDKKEVLVVAWQRPGKVLLAIVNRGEATTARVTIDAKLGLGAPEKWQVADAEAGTSIEKSYAHGGVQELPGAWNADAQKPIERQNNTIVVPVGRHDYRQIVIESR